MSARPLEVKALVPLLYGSVDGEDWESPEACVKALIEELDRVRSDKTAYIGVMQFGRERPFYAGIGPYPGRKSAENALQRHPAAPEALVCAVVPVMSPEGLKVHLKAVG